MARATASGEGLYRMVVPAKAAARFGQGIVRPMVPKGGAGGIFGELVDSTGRITAKARFVPVGGAAAVGTAGGAGATAGVAAAGGTALTVAAPLVLMAVAVGMSAHADHKRRQAVELGTSTKSFPGVDDHGGAFRTHLELASPAIALKRRVVVLQAVEHAQSDPGKRTARWSCSLRCPRRHRRARGPDRAVAPGRAAGRPHGGRRRPDPFGAP